MLLDPLSQIITPSRTPSTSSVTYFMDGPLVPNANYLVRIKLIHQMTEDKRHRLAMSIVLGHLSGPVKSRAPLSASPNNVMSTFSL